jgi:tRNA-Thr(GGU) m(6)t(6)A37 methyltransferase TsaA
MGEEGGQTMKWVALALAAALFTTILGTVRTGRGAGLAPAQPRFTLRPIGVVQKDDERTRIVLDEQYREGLLGLEGWSHVWVFWWFDRNDSPEKRAVLRVHPRGNPANPLTGVFATRSPVRPNLIALTLCKITAVEGNVVELEKIDAFDGTPVLDMKPYIPGYDTAQDASVPEWMDRK